MSLEDDFHNKLHLNTKSLVIRFNVNKMYIQKIKDNICSDKTQEILSMVNSDKFINYTPKDIIENNHPLFFFEEKENYIDLYVNHCYIGGYILTCLVETIIEAKSRFIPKTNLLMGIIYGIYDIKNIIRFIKKPSNNSNTTENLEKLFYYSKNFIVDKNKKCSRLGLAYYNILQDTLTALNKDTITVGITIPFQNTNVYNNVGVIYFDYNKNSSPEQTEIILKNNSCLAYTTNTFGIYGKKLSKIIGINGYSIRKKIDVVCSTLITDNDCIPGNYSLLPQKDIIESVYISMYIRLSGDKFTANVYANITTKDVNQKWKKIKYVNNP